MILTIFELVCFVAGFLSTVPTALYLLFQHWGHTPHSMMQLMIAVPVLTWASSLLYARTFSGLRAATVYSFSYLTEVALPWARFYAQQSYSYRAKQRLPQQSPATA